MKLVCYLDCFESGHKSDELMVRPANDSDDKDVVEVSDELWSNYQDALKAAGDAKQALIEAAGLEYEGYVKV